MEIGETGNIIFTFKNNGHANSPFYNAKLNSNNPLITIEEPNAEVGQADIAEIFSVSSDFTIDATYEENIITISCQLEAQYYGILAEAELHIGAPIEDFETGDFSKFEWFSEGDAQWEIDNSVYYQGSYSAVSGNIDDGQKSVLKIDIDILNDGEISFYRKVSSETGWDHLFFYIDNVEKNKWSGDENWAKFTYNIPKGLHSLKWVYEKDWSVSSGSDCAWLDDIVFPPFGSINITHGKEITKPQTSISVFPVPFTSKVNFAFNNIQLQNFRIEIYDLTGKKVFSDSKDLINVENYNYTWYGSDVEAGIYLYKIIAGNQAFFGRIIKAVSYTHLTLPTKRIV